ncbi:MAG: PIN domain-containing protein [candidate division NC10 bacterium]|nr:PIN domain-containing protein [candidate division NC10 bacterium]
MKTSVVGDLVLLVLFGVIGFAWGTFFLRSDLLGWYGLIAGLLLGLALILLNRKLKQVPVGSIVRATLGLIVGVLVSRLLFGPLFSLLAPLQPTVSLTLRILLDVSFAYLGLMVATQRGRELDLFSFFRLVKENPKAESHKILDTSVIIDGRIADICETGFIEGALVIPQFVLRELQHIADSSDTLKRNRGRRGLDILQRIQKKVDVPVRIHDLDFPEIKEVDGKLVALAKMLGAKVITNDFNLNKVAELHGVPVLNINELANSLKPVVLPGEDMKVYVLKEGKEYNQGIAYLDDGTMVVIDNGRKWIGQTVEVCVTSVLQTTAGRMIFTRMKEEAEAA